MKTLEITTVENKLKKINVLAIPVMGGYKLVLQNKLLYLEADGNYTHLHVIEDNAMSKITASKNLKYFEDALSGSLFMRIHDSRIVNLTKVVNYFREGKDGRVVLFNGKSLLVSRTKKDELLAVFGIKK